TIDIFQHRDDIAMLRQIVAKANGKLDLDSFPEELVETDEELDKAWQYAQLK
ncbi:unnamed protein product, partial [marine sediment metagenome]